ncbi:MAG: RepB-like protein, partial [Streptococcus thermophilus]
TVKDDTVKDNTVKDDTVKGNTAHFLSEIQFLRTQLENKDTQILQMQNLLDQQQRLALQDKKLLEEYKAEVKDLKDLAITPHDSGTEESPQKEPEQGTSNAKPKTKKWWIFGK